MTVRHLKEDYDAAVEASQISSAMGTEQLQRMDESTFLAYLRVCHFCRQFLSAGGRRTIADLCACTSTIAESKGRWGVYTGGGVSLNKGRFDNADMPSCQSAVNNRYLLLQKGKKSYFLIRVI